MTIDDIKTSKQKYRLTAAAIEWKVNNPDSMR